MNRYDPFKLYAQVHGAKLSPAFSMMQILLPKDVSTSFSLKVLLHASKACDLKHSIIISTLADLRQAEGKHRKDGKRAQLVKPTTHQQQIIQRLIEAHGEDIQVPTLFKEYNCLPKFVNEYWLAAHQSYLALID